MSKAHRVEFPGTDFTPVEIAEGSNLSEVLTAENSPVLFGCRTGICGTCLSSVDAAGQLEAPDPEEQEVLEVISEDEPNARLCCQLSISCDLKIVHIGA